MVSFDFVYMNNKTSEAVVRGTFERKEQHLIHFTMLVSENMFISPALALVTVLSFFIHSSSKEVVKSTCGLLMVVSMRGSICSANKSTSIHLKYLLIN